MLEIIIKLLIALGLYTSSGPTKNILVIDQNTGASYNIGIGITGGGGTSVTHGSTSPDVYYLVHNPDGSYSLLRR